MHAVRSVGYCPHWPPPGVHAAAVFRLRDLSKAPGAPAAWRRVHVRCGRSGGMYSFGLACYAHMPPRYSPA